LTGKLKLKLKVPAKMAKMAVDLTNKLAVEKLEKDFEKDIFVCKMYVKK